jgi:hypothetical protein
MKSRSGQNVVARSGGISRIAMAALVASVLACGETTSLAGSVRIQPAAASVALQNTPLGLGLQTSITLTNTSSTPIRWSTCGMALEKGDVVALESSDGSWVPVWTEVCLYALDGVTGDAAITTAPPIGGIVLNPGTSVVIPITVPVGQTPYSFFNGEPGIYRVRLYLSTDVLGHNYTLPRERSVSDSFILTAN